MRKKFVRALMLSTAGGMILQLGGCVGDIFGSGFLLDLARSALFEFVWDNDVLLDFFGDSAPGILL
jgi:hypothetical protein